MLLLMVRKYIAKHKENPGVHRVRCKDELQQLERVVRTEKDTLRQKGRFRFFEVDAWKKKHPGQEIQKTVAKQIAGVGLVEGVWVDLNEKGEWDLRHCTERLDH